MLHEERPKFNGINKNVPNLRAMFCPRTMLKKMKGSSIKMYNELFSHVYLVLFVCKQQ